MSKPTTFSTGRLAEQSAADHLRQLGYQIVNQNWRTKWCEIDIVAQLDQTIYFVEVKYRRTNSSGAGLDYITARKLGQMSRAAESWVQQYRWSGEYTLAVAEVSGQEYTVTELLLL